MCCPIVHSMKLSLSPQASTCYISKARGVTPIAPCPELRLRSKCSQRVKTLSQARSNDQVVLWGLCPALLVIKRYGQAFAHEQLIDSQWVKAKTGHQMVKVIIGWSKILTAVAALDTVPMGVTPLDQSAPVTWLDLYPCDDDDHYRSHSSTRYLSMRTKSLLCKIMIS